MLQLTWRSLRMTVLLMGFTLLTAVGGRWFPADVVAAEANFRIHLVDVRRGLYVDVSPSPYHYPLYGYPAWSPDGTHLAFHRWYIGDRVGDVTLLDVYSGHVTRHTTASNYQDLLSWGPDGQQIAFISTDSPDPSRRYNVALLDVEHGTQRQLTHDGQVVNPLWSPDGTWIAFRALGQVSIIEPNPASIPYALTEQGGYQSVNWSPDGTRLSVLSYGGTHDSSFTSVIAVIQPGQQTDTFTCDDVNPELYAIWSPGWRYLATHTATRGLTVIDMETCVVRFTNRRNSGVSPLWLDENNVVFASAHTLIHADITSGHTSRLRLPGAINHIVRKPR